MNLQFSREEVEILRDILRQRIIELDKEINRTDSLDYKKGLRQLDRTMERILGEVTSALASAPSV